MSKLIKNPLRGQSEIAKPYVPQYKLRGLTPAQIAGSSIPETHKKMFLTKHAPVVSYDNPRVRPPPAIRANVPYAEAVNLPLDKGQILPNVGNNVENTWASVDESVIDDLGINSNIDPNHPMIDNNDDDLNNFSSIPDEIQAPPMPQMMVPEDEQEVTVQDEYMLIVGGEISTGTLSSIQDEVRSLVIDHDVPMDDIVVFKKMKIKMGIFIGE
ncbi:MAG TPA: hypothetical protein VNW06_02045 [Cytophagaceae bacterium]|jgi:hypothetical protein|nr:hypothetical protein [Cytophagaceae bacterium]